MLRGPIITISFLLLSSSFAQIFNCPTAESQVLLSDGSIYAVCVQTDYEGDTTKFVGDITSVAECAKACNEEPQCKQAVYQQGGCHLKKPDAVRWTANIAYTTVRFVSKLESGALITSCIPGFKNITTGTGTIYATCPYSDYNGPSNDIQSNVPTVEECVQRCNQKSDCAFASYDTQYKVCHLKGTITAPRWVFNNQFTSLQRANVIVAPAPTSSQSSTRTATQPLTQTSSSTPTSIATVARLGRWGNVIQFPIIPVAAYVVPGEPSSSRVLVFSSWGERAFSGPTGITQFADYNFNTGTVSKRTVTNTRHDMFCPGISSLADGRIVINGGSDAEAVSIYNPTTNQFTRAANMQIARGYQTSTTLSNGDVFTIGGSFTGGIFAKPGETYNAANNKWTLLPDADPGPLLTTDREGAWRTDNHAWLFGWRNGSVFQAGPSKAMHWYSTSGRGSVTSAGTRTTEMDQMCGVNVMYDVGKILSAGGSQDYTDSQATKLTHLISITDPGRPATVERGPDMAFARGFANGVVLPDGKVIVTGGQARSLVFTDINSVLVAEMFDPASKTWTPLAPAAVPRNYHSVSILLPDGTVFVGGGGMCPAAQGDNLDWCDRAKDHFDGEIFSPPYLFTPSGSLATRPAISQLSASRAIVGATITVTLSNNLAGASFSMVRMGSATHSINSDQRRVPLSNVQAGTAGSYTIRLPNDSGVLLPGPWYLFAMSKEGVPSVARTVYIQA